MRYSSTRDAGDRVAAGVALERGLARDGGLYVPCRLPALRPDEFDGRDGLASVGEHLLAPFFHEDPLAGHVGAICADAFDFPIPNRELEAGLSVLELFHGPTAAFKDVGARFLARCLERINEGRQDDLLILVATSGDTGGAVAAAFHQRPGIDVAVLFPAGLVSPRQEQQLTCWGGNVSAFRVAGSFDDCQRLVKEAFRDEAMRLDHRLCSANSINIGRLLPQMVYYAWSSLEFWRRHGSRPGYIVPTGNLGNAVACLYAREIGLPIGPIVLATNANRPVPDFLETLQWRPRPGIATLASAMDVGDPSNMERLRVLYDGPESIAEAVQAFSISDDRIRARIVAEFAETGEIWCPHTATGFEVYRVFLTEEQRKAHHWICVATAHAAKFDTIVEPLIGREVEVPPPLARLLDLPAQAETIEADLDALRRKIDVT